jgi:3-methyladenine DNA glycosylase AlkD
MRQKSRENEELIQKVKMMSRAGFHNVETITSEDIDVLTQNIKSTDEKLVEKIYWAMGQIGIHGPEKVKHLINYAFEDLKNECPAIRENALFALGRTGRANINLVKDRIDEIIRMHKDDNPKVRVNMIWACENLANSKADLFEPYINIFEKMLDDTDEQYVKKEIPEIFRVIGKYNPELVEKSLEKLKGKLNDDDRVMRIHIEGAIKVIEKGLLKRLERYQVPVRGIAEAAHCVAGAKGGRQ